MVLYSAENVPVPVDKDGFLKNLTDWSPAIAEQLASAENIQLTPSHWQLIDLIRDFYQVFGLSPAMRPLVNYAAKQLGPEKGRSIYFLQHFPGSPAKLLSKIAGLPRPENCL